MSINFLVLFLLVVLAVVALRQNDPIALRGYRLLTILSLFPYLLHTWFAWQEISGFGPPIQPATGVYPGLVAFAASSLLAQLGLGAIALMLDRRYLLGLVLVPLVAGLFYWQVALKLLKWRSPEFIFLDNVPLIWLAGLGIVSALLLGICGWVSLRGSTQPRD